MNNRDESELERFLESCTPEENQPIEEVRKDLESYGYDVDSLIAETLHIVAEIKRDLKPSWLDVAAKKQAQFENSLKTVRSWALRPAKEIELAFQAALASKQAQAAFRNAKSISIEDKAAFLDELDALDNMEDNGPNA